MEQHNAPGCPLRNGERCTMERCAWWNPIGEECSINLIAEALISVVDLKSRFFTAKISMGSRITIPADIRYDLDLEDGDRIKLAIVKEEEEAEE